MCSGSDSDSFDAPRMTSVIFRSSGGSIDHTFMTWSWPPPSKANTPLSSSERRPSEGEWPRSAGQIKCHFTPLAEEFKLFLTNSHNPSAHRIGPPSDSYKIEAVLTAGLPSEVDLVEAKMAMHEVERGTTFHRLSISSSLKNSYFIILLENGLFPCFMIDIGPEVIAKRRWAVVKDSKLKLRQGHSSRSWLRPVSFINDRMTGSITLIGTMGNDGINSRSSSDALGSFRMRPPKVQAK